MPSISNHLAPPIDNKSFSTVSLPLPIRPSSFCFHSLQAHFYSPAKMPPSGFDSASAPSLMRSCTATDLTYLSLPHDQWVQSFWYQWRPDLSNSRGRNVVGGVGSYGISFRESGETGVLTTFGPSLLIEITSKRTRPGSNEPYNPHKSVVRPAESTDDGLGSTDPL